MIWFLTFGKNGSAGMPAVPATILMSGFDDFEHQIKEFWIHLALK